MPVGVRSTSDASMSASVATALLGASAAKRCFVVAGLSATDSTSVFQAPQWGHLPSQRGLTPPQSLQVKRVFSLAMWAAI